MRRNQSKINTIPTKTLNYYRTSYKNQNRNNPDPVE